MTQRRKHQTVDRQARELVRRGWSRRDADSLVGIASALGAAPRADRAQQRQLSHRVVSALRRESVACGAESMLVDPDMARSWRLLADWLEGEDQMALLRLAAASDGREVVSVPPDEVAALVNPDDLHVHVAARAAEARGDFARAIELLAGTVRPADDGWFSDLQTMLEDGERLGPAVWGRWICAAATRYCLDHPVRLDLATRLAAVALEACGATDEQLRDLTLERALRDQVVHDAVLFDEGGLEMYLTGPLGPEVVARVPGLARWPQAPVAVVRYEQATPAGEAVCRSLLDGSRAVVADDGLAAEQTLGTCLLGRLVGIDGDDRRWFACKPTILDDVTATRVAAAVAGGASTEQRLVQIHRGLRR